MPRSPGWIPRSSTHRAIPLVCGTIVGLLTPLAVAGQSDRAAPARPATAKTMVDPAVQPAGGGGCRECGPSGCRHCHKHHHGCRDGVCVAACPVRPGTFGYYGTQWRRWPGQGVVPVSGTQAIMPEQPPKSAVPGADEESFSRKPDELPEPSGPMMDSDGQSPLAPEPDADQSAAPAGDAWGGAAPAAAEPRTVPDADQPRPSRQVEPAEEPKAKPADDNLFDDSSARKVRRKIPVHTAAAPQAAAGSRRVVATAHVEDAAPTPPAAGTRSVPRVAFDPRAAMPRSAPSRSGPRP